MLALRNLTRRRVRTLLTVVGVAVGIAAVVALVAVARGIREQINEFFATGDAHLVLSRKGASDPFISYLPSSLPGELRGTGIVSAAFPVLLGATQLQGHPIFLYYGTTEGSPLLSQFRIVDGLGPLDPRARRPAVCLGRAVAEHLRLGVGSSLTMHNDVFTVSVIFESALPLQEAGGVMSFDDAQRVAGLEGKMTMVLVQLDPFDPDRIEQVEAALEDRFPEVEATAPGRFSHAFDEFDLADQAVTVLTILAVFVGGIGVTNTMLMSVFERTREIGILQAVGWSKGMIVRSVLAEGLIVCLLGGPLGICMGIGAVEVIGSIGEFTWVAGAYNLEVFAQAMAVAVAMGLVGAVYPALRAVRITPIEALRYE